MQKLLNMSFLEEQQHLLGTCPCASGLEAHSRPEETETLGLHSRNLHLINGGIFVISLTRLK